MDTAGLIEAALIEGEIEYERMSPTSFAVTLPGEARLKTTCLLAIGEHALSVQAFVLRHPDENQLDVHTWLLKQNARMYAVAWMIDDAGDVYLTGKVPLSAIDADELDRILGAVLEYADGSFNYLVQLGFGSAIRREWAWRVKNGELTANLAAFAEFAQRAD